MYYHAIAIGEGLPSIKYEIEKSNRVLMVFEHERTKLSVQKKLAELPAFSNLYNHFLFKHISESLKQFEVGWTLIDGKEVKLI